MKGKQYFWRQYILLCYDAQLFLMLDLIFLTLQLSSRILLPSGGEEK